jgi:hypothetical protein
LSELLNGQLLQTIFVDLVLVVLVAGEQPLSPISKPIREHKNVSIYQLEHL